MQYCILRLKYYYMRIIPYCVLYVCIICIIRLKYYYKRIIPYCMLYVFQLIHKYHTEDVMLLAAIIVRRHLTPTLYVLVCINPVLRWTEEGNSGLRFHQKQSSIPGRLEEVMCTWIMCTCEQALIREICVCPKACV